MAARENGLAHDDLREPEPHPMVIGDRPRPASRIGEFRAELDCHAELLGKFTVQRGQRVLAGLDEARRRGLFFAEAMWMRTNPNIRRLRAMAADGACGTVTHVRADLGFVAPRDKARLWDPALGASALLDVGIYPLTFAYLVLGRPVEVRAVATLSDRGVDVAGGATLRFDGGAIASISWTQTGWPDTRASVAGDGGRLELPSPFHHPQSFTYARNWEADEIAEPVLGAGYAHEIIEVDRCLRDGLTESPLLPLDETVDILAVMDEIREQVGATTG